MVKRLFLILAMGAAVSSANAQYQLDNSSFENWEEISYKKNIFSTLKGDEPKNWSSFLDATGSLKSTGAAVQLYKETSDVHSGTACAKLTSNSILGVVAQGNLTNGCVNMGSMSASDATGNYNYINTDRADQAMTFTGRPDAVEVYVKYSTGASSKGNVEVVLTSSGYYQSPEANTITATKIAKALNDAVDPTNGEWVKLHIPFEYYTSGTPVYALVNISTCATPGGGNASDVMYVDDISMIYNSELELATFDNTSIVFDSNGNASVDSYYDKNKLSLELNGVSATYDTFYDEETGKLTITVKGGNYSEDNSNVHSYTVQFKPLVVERTKEYTDDLLVKVNGSANPVQEATVTVSYLNNGNVNFSLHNFILYTDDGPMPIGNIDLTNLAVTSTGDYSSFSFNGESAISVGDEGYTMEYMGETYTLAESDWSGPSLGTIPMVLTGKLTDNILYVTISITLSTQQVDVTFGYDLKNLTVSFEKADYATLCIPTAASIPTGVKAYSCASTTNGILDTVEESSLAANTPYILENTGSDKTYTILTTEKSNSTIYTNGLLAGVLAATDITSGYVLQNQGGKVGFYQVSGTKTVPANRAYIYTTASVKGFYFGDETADAVKSIVVVDNQEQKVYDLAGRRVKNATKGVYIINGKKILK